MNTNTAWEKVSVSADTAKYIRESYVLWSRIADGDHIFTVLPAGQTPKDGDGGYFSISSAISAKFGARP